MFRLTGALMIAGVCAVYGFSAADRLKRRYLFLREFITSLSVIETEIVFGKYELERIFRGMEDKNALCGIYRVCADRIRGRGIKAAWDEAADKAADKAALRPEDINAVKTLGAELGMSDIGGQKNAIGRTRELSAGCAAAAEDEYRRMGRAYRICGALAGVFCILMIS